MKKIKKKTLKYIKSNKAELLDLLLFIFIVISIETGFIIKPCFNY